MKMGGPDFSNFQKKIARSRAPSRFGTFPGTRVGSFRLKKIMELELEPDSFENHENAFFEGTHFWDFRREHFCPYFLQYIGFC